MQLENARVVKNLHLDSINGYDDQIEQILESIDLDEIVSGLIDYPNKNEPEYQELVKDAVEFISYLENETSIPTPVSDENFDKLSEFYKSISLKDVVTDTSSEVVDGKDVFHHKFPELRGSLEKTYYVYVDDIPEGDYRGSVEAFVYRMEEKLVHDGVGTDLDTVVCCAPKFDGVSHVFECSYGNVDRVLTRYKVEQNLGKDVSHIFKLLHQHHSDKIIPDYPESFKKSKSYGVKTETYMTEEDFELYKSYFSNPACNRRSAITSIVNRKEDNVPVELLNLLSSQAFQISSEDYVELTGSEKKTWEYIGLINGRHNYIWNDPIGWYCVNFKDTNCVLDAVYCSIEPIKKAAADRGIPIDGVVITFMNPDIIRVLGRSNDINRFQVAYKIPAGVKKTTLKEVQFPVGPVAGNITPLAIVEPVVINGSTITNASLSNFDKLEKMNLHIGDEVYIKYDIIPKLFKDDTCKESDSPQIVRPEHCPVCGADVTGFCCSNPYCPSKLSGKIYNYIQKMRIPHIGRETVNDLCRKGILGDIPDLYTLPLKKDQIISLPGYGQGMYDLIVGGVYQRNVVYIHELLGAIGIPGCSTKTMRNICEYYNYLPIYDIITLTEDELKQVHGIGDAKAKKIAEGFYENYDLLNSIFPRFEFKSCNDDPNRKVITFSTVRDPDFASYLEDCGCEVSAMTKRTTMVITKDNLNLDRDMTPSIQRAIERGLPIYSLSRAKKEFKYRGDET